MATDNQCEEPSDIFSFSESQFQEELDKEFETEITEGIHEVRIRNSHIFSIS